MMKRIALLVVFAMLIGTTPIYAASASNTTTITNTTLNQQIQGKEQQLSQGVKNQIKSLRGQIKSLRDQIQQNRQQMLSLFTQNKNLKKQLNSTGNNTTIQTQISQNRAKMLNLRSDNKNLRSEIKDLHQQIKSLL
ncbi:MAG: hypothetical protein ACLQG5_08215 [Methanobacterium sp.]|jgi:peptidoglycan hydrolase CwlO-like protein